MAIYKTLTAKDGMPTLKVNGYSVYGNYRPLDDARRLIYKEFDKSVKKYFILGLGYGYHLQALMECIEATEEKLITVYALDKYEEELFKDSPIYRKLKNDFRIRITSCIEELEIDEETQLILPQAWVNAMGCDHPLYMFIVDIKIKQRSFNEMREIMLNNFKANIAHKEFHLKQYNKMMDLTKIACLVSSGPSLQETYPYLLEHRKRLFIISVGSALRVLLHFGIVPDAVVVVDPSKATMEQFQDLEYSGPLFYLSTAYKETTRMLNGQRYILFQKGYRLAEQLAQELNFPLLDTGSSVATAAVSLLELFGYKQIILFGQDLGFKGKKTHVMLATSGTTYKQTDKLLQIPSNEGKNIFTEKGLYTFLKWFEYKAKNTEIQFYNTAFYGAKIEGIPYITKREFNQIVEQLN